MRAAYIETTGPVEHIQVGNLPKPEPGPGQALIRVKAVAINPIDLYVRSGMVAMPLSFPYVIGSDFCGIVEAVGPNVNHLKPGERVWGSNQGLLGRQGVASEFAAIDEVWCHPTPENLSDAEAAAQALTGITAHLGLFHCGRLQPGESVYVSGGSGGVGSLVIQMAKAVGARVATTAGSPEKQALCRSLGADVAMNYRTDDLAEGLRSFAPEGVDVWYETQREPNLELAIPLLRKRGRMIVMAGRTAKPVLPLGAFYPRDCSLHGFAMFNASHEEQDHCAEDMNRWSEEGKLRAHVGRVFPLDQAAEAERFLEQNTLGGVGTLSGKVVIAVA